MSRYKKDFEEMGPLGKGGFGSVFKVKQLLDDRLVSNPAAYLS